ncbi:Protein of unknown function (DUF819) [Seminavis robusta]|uniref:Uncharacterized protein n=1 Tax=Seminavis robusta TaxID=568900 RepID=A0A9N8HQU8_9STRA|nr:Protein of unknown function (DUF819) [Seminavis robusta]|eukprot:Sro1017_g231810.1 Protein of unknown function (DUF819) (406) ;mRNA; r:38358-39660
MASSTLKTLHGDSTFVLTAILWLSTFGISLEKRTTLGKALSAPLATMALALTVANLGIIPFESPIYAMTNRYLIPLAVPMLLFDSDLKRVVTDTGSLLLAFAVGAVATVVGTLVAFPLLPLTSMGPNVGWRVACALAARHIGGAINFVAVAETLNISGSAVSAAIAADNVVVALYFAFLFAMSPEGEDDDNESDNTQTEQPQSTDAISVVDPESVSDTSSSSGSSNINLSTLAVAISVASTLVAGGRGITRWILPPGTSALPMISLLTVIAATLRPNFFARIRSAGTALGIVFIQMFFATSGAAGSLRLVLQQAPSLFVFSALQIAVHYVVLVTLGRGLFRLPFRELHLASNANVGGPTTAAAMAQAKQWKRLVLPALLVGILGYATATAIALSLGPILLKLPTR